MKGSKVSSKGQVTLPIEARKHLNIQPGVRVRFVLEKDSIRIVPVESGIETLRGTIEVSEPQDFKVVRHQAMKELANERNTHH
jgi:antitoxin PrlF